MTRLDDAGTTFVSVVYEAEYPLLELQARSMAVHLRADQVRDIFVIDNSAKGMPEALRRALLADYGPLARMVTIFRPEDICRAPGAVGWNAQQVLKLSIASRVRSRYFVVLDAKNHLIGPLPVGYFEAADGRLRVPSYSYETHPLRKNLEHVLGYLHLDPSPQVRRFTATVTPFALNTAVVTSMIADIERRSGRSFAREFLQNDLTEFFLYAGWIIAQGHELREFYDLDLPLAPTIWPRAAGVPGVIAATASADEGRSPFFAVHRRALAVLGAESARLLADFWAGRGLFPSPAAAREFLAGYARLHEREAKAQARRDLPRKLLAVPRKVRRKLMSRLRSATR